MGMPALQPPPEFWTAEMVRALPEDGRRHEVVFGEHLVTPAPSLLHQLIVDHLAQSIRRYLEREPVGRVFTLAADISWRQDALVQPDLFVAPEEEFRTLDWRQVRSLSLVAEVVSPASRRVDRFSKRRLYQDASVPLYWVVDTEARLVECWTPAAQLPIVERDTLDWHPTGAVNPFRMALTDLFAPI